MTSARQRRASRSVCDAVRHGWIITLRPPTGTQLSTPRWQCDSQSWVTAWSRHVDLPQLELVVDDFLEPAPLLRVGEGGRQRAQVELQHGLVAEQAVERLEQPHVAVQLDEARVSEEVEVHPQRAGRPLLHRLVARGAQDAAHVLGVPGAEVAGQLHGGQRGHALRLEALLDALVDVRRVDEHLVQGVAGDVRRDVVAAETLDEVHDGRRVSWVD